LSDQLVEAKRDGLREAFTYDSAGSMVTALAELGGVRREVPPEVGAGNALLSAGATSYGYDVRGRRERKTSLRDPEAPQTTEYTWDARDRLRAAVLPDGTRVSLAYDALGRRVRKETIPADRGPSRLTEYVWDGYALAMQLDSAEGPRVFVHEPDNFVPLLQQQRGEVFVYVVDHVGTAKDLLTADGRIAWSGAHGTWGGLVAEYSDLSAGPFPVRSPFGLLGQIRDEDLGLSFTHFRLFDPDVGRWISPDPAGLDGGWNAYAFDGAPTVVVDPLGLAGSPHSAAETLPRLQGRSVPAVHADLTKAGFQQTKVSNSPAKNETWEHPDGSVVRVHPYGNEKTTMANGDPTPKSGLNAHVHKVDPQGNDLDDSGYPSTDPDETHIGVKNPADLPTVRNRPHGSGS